MLLRRIGRGARLYHQSASVPQQILRLAGVITARPDGELTTRNKLFESAFTARWVSSVMPFNWRAAAVAAAVAAALIVAVVWQGPQSPEEDETLTLLRRLGPQRIDLGFFLDSFRILGLKAPS